MATVLAKHGAAQQTKLKFGTAADGGGFIVYAGAFVDAGQWANPKL